MKDAIPVDVIFEMVRRLLTFPYPMVCRHSVAADLLNAIRDVGYPVSPQLEKAVVFADDESALAILSCSVKPV